MTQAVAANPSLIKRVAHVLIVALCTASSLLLIGAVPAKWAMDRNAVVAKPAAVAQVTTADTVKFELISNIRAQVTGGVKALDAVAAAAPKTRVMRMEVTAYCPCTKCCGPKAQGITASGKHVSHNDGKFVAADTSILPFGTELVIPGYADGFKVEVADRGGAIKGYKLDLFFPTHAEALVWGRQHVDVVVYE